MQETTNIDVSCICVNAIAETKQLLLEFACEADIQKVADAEGRNIIILERQLRMGKPEQNFTEYGHL